MPSFLNKVFGYKKHDDKEPARPVREPSSDTLLDGKYEAIAPVLLPTASTFAETLQTKSDAAFSLFRPKKSAQRQPEDVPHLTLQLPGPKENRALGFAFEADPDSQIILDDAIIAAKRLSPSEALILIRACTQAITERGLETLGIMHPQWFSASPDIQRRLISLFIRSLSRTTTLPPTPTSPTTPTSTFESELHYTRLPHDVAAVLRWGLRHLSLENGQFGKDNAEWGWYNTFFQAERSASYPVKGFSELLLPQLPASHAQLLTATLGLISSLASHAETNSISGSKLSKFLGLWLLVATRAEEADDWNRFYARWERSGRVLEHLFLARLREESSVQRLPTRLQELVQSYPYNKGSPVPDEVLLSRPRFSTRQYDALFVRVESLLTQSGVRPKQHPIQLLLDAFQLPIDDLSGNEHTALWNALKTAVLAEATSSEGPQFTRIFVDETIHLLSSIPIDNNPLSPTLLTSPFTQVVSRKPSASTSERTVSRSNTSNGHTPASPPTSPVITDWAGFTQSGFGDAPTTQPLAGLLSQNDDIEITQPRVSRKSGRVKSRSRGRRSKDREALDTPASESEATIVGTKLASVHVVQIDEAFIDFWSDAIVEPVSANWPTFVVCGLKQVPSAEQPIRWLVIEQAYTRQEPQRSRVPSPDGRRGRSPRPSFKSDITGFRINSVFSTARKRLSMFSKSATDLDSKKSSGKTPVVGELGEILVEEGPPVPSAPPVEAGLHDAGNAAVSATVTGGATVNLPDQLNTSEISTATPPVPPPKESDPIQAAVKAPSFESGPPSTGSHYDSSVIPRPSVSASEETICGERDPPQAPGLVDSEAIIIPPLTADTPSLRSAQDGCDPKGPEGTIFSEEHPIAEDVPIQAGNGQQGGVDRPVELVAETTDRDTRLHTEATEVSSDVVQAELVGDGSREDAEVVAMPSGPETVALGSATPTLPPVVVVAVNDAPELAVEEPHVAQPSADHVAAFTVESVGQQEIDDLGPPSSSEVIATESGAQLEPQSMTAVVDEEAQEIAGRAEIPTPSPELVAVVEETPGLEAPADECGCAGDGQNPATQPEVPDDAAPQLVDAASQPAAAELQAAVLAEESRPAEAPCVEVVDTSVGAEQVPELPEEEVQPHVQDNVPEAPLAEAPSTQPEDAAPAETQARPAPPSSVHEDPVTGTEDAGTLSPLPEYAASVDETPGPVIPAGTTESVDADPVASLELEEVEAKTQEPVTEAIVEAKSSPTLVVEEAQPSSAAELSTQVRDAQTAVEALSTTSNLEGATAALATQDEVIVAVTAETPTTLGPFTRDSEAPISVAEVAVDASELVPPEAQPECDAPEPDADGSQVLVDAAPTASEPVAITPIVLVPLPEPVVPDVRTPIETDEPSTAPAPQSVDEAGATRTVDESTAEEEVAVAVQVEAPDVAPPTIDTDEEAIAEDAKPASATPEPDMRVGETQVVLDAAEPGVLAPDAPTIVEAQDAAAVVQVTASQSEIDERAEVDQPQQAELA